MPGPERKHWLLAGAGAVVLNLLVFLPVYAGLTAVYFRDILVNHAPATGWLASRLASGQAPLWCDRILGGMPFWGDPVQGVLYPGRLLLIPFSGLHPLQLYGIFAGIHFLVAQAGYFRLGARLGLRPWAAFAVSASIAYGGCALTIHSLIQFLLAFSLLGWAGVALLDHLRAPSVRSALAVSFWTALMVTTGDLQCVYLFSLFALAVSLFGADRGRRQRTVLLTGGALGLAALIAAAAILPGLELSAESSRREVNTADYSSSWSWNPVRIVEWAAPGLFDPPPQAAVTTGHLERGVAGENGFYFNRAAPGILVLAMLPAVLWSARRDRGILWLLGCSVLALLVAMGENLPLWGAARALLPGWDQFRFPERQLLQAFIALALASGLALEHLLRENEGAPRRLLSGAAVFLGLLLALALSGVTPDGASGWLEALGFRPFPELTLHAALAFRIGAVLIAGGAAVWILLQWQPKLVPWVLTGLVIAELSAAGFPVLRQVPAEIFPRPLELEKMLPASAPGAAPVPARIFVDVDREVRGKDARLVRAALDWQRLAGDLVMLTPWSVPGGYNSSRPMDHELASRTIPAATGLRLQSLDYLVTEEGREPQAGYDCGGEDIPVLHGRICRHTAALPPARAPKAWKVLTSADLEAKLSGPGWDPAAIEYLGPRLSGRPAAAPPGGGGKAGNASVQVKAWTPERRTLAVLRGEAGPVVLRDNYFPGWKVYVDGKPAGDALVANGFQLAAWTPAGESVVEFRYEPWTVRAGMIVSVLALILAAGLWVSGGKDGKAPVTPG